MYAIVSSRYYNITERSPLSHEWFQYVFKHKPKSSKTLSIRNAELWFIHAGNRLDKLGAAVRRLWRQMIIILHQWHDWIYYLPWSLQPVGTQDASGLWLSHPEGIIHLTACTVIKWGHFNWNGLDNSHIILISVMTNNNIYFLII